MKGSDATKPAPLGGWAELVATRQQPSIVRMVRNIRFGKLYNVLLRTFDAKNVVACFVRATLSFNGFGLSV